MGNENGRKKIDVVEEMPVFQDLFRLAVDAERITKRYHADFRWLRSQTLRASESACANLTEGFYTQYSTEYLQALYRSRREARETMTHLRYALEIGRLDEDSTAVMLDRYRSALKQLAGLIASIERKIRDRGKSKSFSLIGHRPLTMGHSFLEVPK